MSAPKASNNFIAIFIAAFARKHFVQINRPLQEEQSREHTHTQTNIKAHFVF
jgi:hypothetical protein